MAKLDTYQPLWVLHIISVKFSLPITGIMRPYVTQTYRGVTSEKILGRGNNHYPSNGSGRYNPHIVTVELLNPHAAA